MIYDDFQKQAIGHIDNNHTLIVAAPTGAGKTIIAEYAIEHAAQKKKAAIYTAPIKALSNQKYRDFRARYGEEKVGILTGDVSINSEAPILIMTTEIYRNTLFENIDRFKNVSWVIFDEIHYLDDIERGTVWEESIMFSPPHIQFIGLSATVPNVGELAEWISAIHKRPVHVVEETHRPVPLKHRFQCQGRILYNMRKLRSDGYLGCENWQGAHSRHGRKKNHRFLRLKPNRLNPLIHHIKDAEELPCIYFVFGRSRAKYLAEEMTHYDFLNSDEQHAANELFWQLCEKYGLTEERTALELFDLIRRGIAYHHAGMLPSLKEVVEQLFTHKLLKLIFTTETFALGINMPARSVVFDELRKFFGTHFGNLRTRDYYQMAGRAGRRGMDEAGFVYSRINPKYISYPDVVHIINGKPEAVKSQFNATYATVLNLYREFKRDLISIYPRSFHYFQSGKKKRKHGFSLLERKLNLLEDMQYITEEGITDKGDFASSLYGYELTLSEMHTEEFLESLNELELSVILASLVFEPRKSDLVPVLPKHINKLTQTTDFYTRMIHKKEKQFLVRPFSKPCHFHLALAVEGWMKGLPFETVTDMTTVDEGEIVRAFRMVIQLLRQLRDARGAEKKLKASASLAIELINKDIIDAEKQLKV